MLYERIIKYYKNGNIFIESLILSFIQLFIDIATYILQIFYVLCIFIDHIYNYKYNLIKK